MILSQVSSAESTKSSITSMPALLTRMSGGPSAERTRLTAARTAALSAMSTATPTARTPWRSARPAAVLAAAAASRSQTATAAPSAARAAAIAAPMPRPAPVTIAVLPCSLKFPCSLMRPPRNSAHFIYITYYTYRSVAWPGSRGQPRRSSTVVIDLFSSR